MSIKPLNPTEKAYLELRKIRNDINLVMQNLAASMPKPEPEKKPKQLYVVVNGKRHDLMENCG